MKKLFTRAVLKKVFFLAAVVFLSADALLLLIRPDLFFPALFFIPAVACLTAAVVLQFYPRIKAFLHVDLIVDYLPLTRVVYATLCLFTAIQHLTLIPSGLEPINFYSLGIPTPGFFAYFVTIVYIASLVLLLVGKWVRLAWVLIFLAGSLVIPLSLETFVKVPMNFFSMFLPAAMWTGSYAGKDKKYGWPLVLLGVSQTFLVTGAGIYKLLDPVWLEGLGMYYSLNIPYFLPKHLWFLLDYKEIMVTGNWITIVAEVLAFPLFIFRRTRPYAIILVIMLGAFLAYPMAGIGITGGAIILSFVPALLSISGIRINALISLGRFFSNKGKYDFNDQKGRPEIAKYQAIGMAVFIYTLTGIISLCAASIGHLKYWPVQYPFYISKNKWLDLPGAINGRVMIINKYGQMTRPKLIFESVWLLPLFDYHHLFDRTIIKVLFDDGSGKWQEHTVFYNDDGSISDKNPMWHNERFTLASWRVMELIQVGVKPGDIVRDKYSRELNATIKYALDGQYELDDFKKAIIQIKHLDQPYTFEGNTKPWASRNWLTFYEYDIQNQIGRIVEMPEQYDFTKLSVPAFRHKQIVPMYLK